MALLQLLFQFLSQLVLARLFGAASEMDAFVPALALPVGIAMILTAALGSVLVPIYTACAATKGELEAHAVASQFGLYVPLASGVVTVFVVAVARSLAAVLCPGFTPALQTLMAELLQILALLIVANSLVAYLNALYHCERRFAPPAIAGVIGTLSSLGYIIAFHSRQGIFAVAWGVVCGAAVTTAILLPRMLRHLRQPLARQFAPHSETRQAFALLIPLLFGAIFCRLDPLVDRWLGSYFAEGSIAHLGYAWRLTMALMVIGTSGLSIVVFPTIAAHATANRWPELSGEFAQSLRLLTFLLVPVCLGVGLFAEPVVRLLFERGHFTAVDSQAVAALITLYLGVVVGTCAGDLVSRTLFALRDTRTPVIVNALSITITIGLKYLLAEPAGASGLAAATSFYHLFNAGILAAILLHRLGRDMLAGVASSLTRYIASAAVACLAASWIGQLWTPIAVLPAMAAGAVVYLMCVCLMRDEFAVRLIEFARQPRRRSISDA